MANFSIYMSKQFIPCQCDLLAIKCFFFNVNLRAQFLYIKKDWWRARAWLRGSLGTDRRRNNMAADNFFIPNAEEFFASILSIFSQCTACLDVREGDQAELLSRRLEQYEETLRVMYQRITESRPDQGALRCDIEQLLNALRRILERLESLYCDNN